MSRLGPGGRIVGGRVLYSAAWLDGTPTGGRRRRSVNERRREGLLLAQRWFSWFRFRSLGAERRRDQERVR
jgi:hypothetical protein